MIANKNTMLIITPMEAMTLLGLSGRATAVGIMRHQARFSDVGIVVIEDTPLGAGQYYHTTDVVLTAEKYYRKVLTKTAEEVTIDFNASQRAKREVRYAAEADHLRYDMCELEFARQPSDWTEWLAVKAQIRADLPYIGDVQT